MNSWRFSVALLSLLVGAPALAQNQADVSAVNRVIDQYSATEDAGDVLAQARLMTNDRVQIVSSGGGRRTDQAWNTRLQQDAAAEAKQLAPGIKWHTDARDRLIKFHGSGDVAIASFYWYRARVIPADLPAEKVSRLPPAPGPSIITLVLVKTAGEWKIAHSQGSPLFPPGT